MSPTWLFCKDGVNDALHQKHIPACACATVCYAASTTRVSNLLRRWKLGFAASFPSSQLKIIGLLGNRVQESAPKSLLFHALIGNEIGTTSTSFPSRTRSNSVDSSSVARPADGRARATLIAAIEDRECDSTLKRWPGMKRLDESRRTLPWTDSPHTPVTASGDSKAERGLVQACRRFVTES